MTDVPTSDGHGRGADGLLWEQSRWKVARRITALCVARPLTSLNEATAARRGPLTSPRASAQGPLPGGPPSHGLVSTFGAVSTHKFMGQLSLLIWLQDETINRCQTHWQ